RPPTAAAFSEGRPGREPGRPSALPTVPEARPAPPRPAAMRKSAIPFLDGSVLKHLLAGLDRLDDFDDIIDVRTPLEYADD
ncbi:hypothetical protein LZB55_09675, partial [Campylobacter lari]|nr:hypothetical protein [Campylobacter lari]